MSDLFSAGSEGSTSDSNEQDTGSCSNAKPTSGDEQSSPSGSRKPPATRTFVKSQKAHHPEDCERWEEAPAANTLSPRDGTAPSVLVFTQNQRDELRDLGDQAAALSGEGSKQTNYLALNPQDPQRQRIHDAEGIHPTLQGGRSGERGFNVPNVLVSSPGASPARTCPSPDDEPGSSTETDPPSFSSSPGSQMSLYGPEGMPSLRTFPDFFPRTVDEISPSFSRRWPSSGFTTSPGESWTADTSECPSGGGEFSSLADVLEDSVALRYFLSPKAAGGIMCRAKKRGRVLPEHLAAALENVAGHQTPSE